MGAEESGQRDKARLTDLAREILDLTAAAGGRLAAGDVEGLLELLDRRGALMEEFDRTAAALGEPGMRPLDPEAQSALRRAFSLEEENLRQAEGKLAAARAFLEEFYRRRGTWRAYREAGSFGRGCFVDTEK